MRTFSQDHTWEDFGSPAKTFASKERFTKTLRQISKFQKRKEEGVTRWDSFLVFNFGVGVPDGVIWLDAQCNRLSGEGLDENLHCTISKSKNKLHGQFLLKVVVREGSVVFQRKSITVALNIKPGGK